MESTLQEEERPSTFEGDFRKLGLELVVKMQTFCLSAKDFGQVRPFIAAGRQLVDAANEVTGFLPF